MPVEIWLPGKLRIGERRKTDARQNRNARGRMMKAKSAYVQNEDNKMQRLSRDLATDNNKSWGGGRISICILATTCDQTRERHIRFPLEAVNPNRVRL
jgi:hypothetical protein